MTETNNHQNQKKASLHDGQKMSETPTSIKNAHQSETFFYLSEGRQEKFCIDGRSLSPSAGAPPKIVANPGASSQGNVENGDVLEKFFNSSNGATSTAFSMKTAQMGFVPYFRTGADAARFGYNADKREKFQIQNHPIRRVGLPVKDNLSGMRSGIEKAESRTGNVLMGTIGESQIVSLPSSSSMLKPCSTAQLYEQKERKTSHVATASTTGQNKQVQMAKKTKDVTRAEIMKEADGVAITVSLSEGSQLKSLIDSRQPQVIWPCKKVVHGEIPTIPCDESNAQRCRLCVQSLISTNTPSTLRLKYVEHDHHYDCRHLEPQSIFFNVLQYVVESIYDEAFRLLWHDSIERFSSSTEYPLYPTADKKVKSLESAPSHIVVEDMTSFHVSPVAQFDIIEIPHVDHNSAHRPLEAPECCLGSRSGVAESGPIAECSAPEINSDKQIVTLEPQRIGLPRSIVRTLSAGSQTFFGKNADVLKSLVSQDCRDVVNYLVSLVHNQLHSASESHRSADISTYLKKPPAVRTKGTNTKMILENRRRPVTRGIKIDFVKLGSHLDHADTASRSSKNDLQKRPADSNDLGKLEQSETKECLSTVNKSRKQDVTALKSFQSGQGFDSASRAKDAMRSERSCGTSIDCGCVICDPKMFSVRLRPNYLVESDFYKIADKLTESEFLTDDILDLLDSDSASDESFSSDSSAEEARTTQTATAGGSCESIRTQCSICFTSFKSSSELRQHLALHEFEAQDEPISSRCPECDICFVDLHIFESKVFLRHCGSNTETMARHWTRRDNHLRNHRANGFNCAFASCHNITFPTRQRLVSHMQLHRVAVMRGGVAQWERAENTSLNTVRLPRRPHIVCEICLAAEFNYHTSLIGMPSHELRYADHVARHHARSNNHRSSQLSSHNPTDPASFNETLPTSSCPVDPNAGEPWCCAFDDCEEIFDTQFHLEQHVWLVHAIECYCRHCDWIVWGDCIDVNRHLTACEASVVDSALQIKTATNSFGVSSPSEDLAAQNFLQNNCDLSSQRNSLDYDRGPRFVATDTQQTSLRVELKGHTSDARATNDPKTLDHLQNICSRVNPFGERAALPANTKNVSEKIALLEPSSSPKRPRGRPRLSKDSTDRAGACQGDSRSGLDGRDINSASSARHLMNFSFFCEHCGAPFRRHQSKRFQLHVASHLPNRTLTCVYDECGRQFSTRQELHSHVKTKLSTCRFCGCVQSKDYKRHISVCRVLGEMERRVSEREGLSRSNGGQQCKDVPVVDPERPELYWRCFNGLRLLAVRANSVTDINGGDVPQHESQAAFLRNLCLLKNGAQEHRKRHSQADDNGELNSHVKKVKRTCTLRVSCHHCQEEFPNSLALKKHFLEYHNDQRGPPR